MFHSKAIRIQQTIASQNSNTLRDDYMNSMQSCMSNCRTNGKQVLKKEATNAVDGKAAWAAIQQKAAQRKAAQQARWNQARLRDEHNSANGGTGVDWPNI